MGGLKTKLFKVSTLLWGIPERESIPPMHGKEFQVGEGFSKFYNRASFPTLQSRVYAIYVFTLSRVVQSCAWLWVSETLMKLNRKQATSGSNGAFIDSTPVIRPESHGPTNVTSKDDPDSFREIPVLDKPAFHDEVFKEAFIKQRQFGGKESHVSRNKKTDIELIRADLKDLLNMVRGNMKDRNI